MYRVSSASSYGTKQEQRMAFEHRCSFAYEQLLKCTVDEQATGPQFITRHDRYFFKWQLFVCPKEKDNDNTLGLYLLPIDHQQKVYAKFVLFCGNEKEVEDKQLECEFKKDKDKRFGCGSPVFLPSVESLKEKKLVVDGVVTMGVKIILNVSDFNPLKWIATPSLTPNTGHIARKLFENLNTGNRRGSDFTIVVGIGVGKKELYVNKVALEGVPFFSRLLIRDSNGMGDGWKENREGTMAMPNFDVGVVKEALRFVYLREIGQNLARFGPPLLDLANQWELTDLKTAIERDMITKLLRSNRLNSSNLALNYFELADNYHLEVLRRVAIGRLIEVWPHFANSPKGRSMANHLKDEVIESAMSAWSGGGVFI